MSDDQMEFRQTLDDYKRAVEAINDLVWQMRQAEKEANELRVKLLRLEAEER